MRRLIAASAITALVFATAACGDDDEGDDTTATPTETSSESVEPSPTESDTGASEDIVATATAAGSFTTLTSALEEAGLVETLQGDGPFTVFAPTDDAFSALPEGLLDDLLLEPEGQLREVLSYHVVPEQLMAADLSTMDGESLTTVQGEDLTVRVDGDQVMLEDVTGNTVPVEQPDLTASNGVIHAIGGVLLPS